MIRFETGQRLRNGTHEKLGVHLLSASLRGADADNDQANKQRDDSNDHQQLDQRERWPSLIESAQLFFLLE